MAVHVFSQKIKNFYTIAIYFNTTRDIYLDMFCAVLGERGTCFYLMIMVTCIYRSQQIAQICISSSLLPNRVTIFPWCPATSIQLITFFGSGMYVSLKRDVFCGSKKFIKQTLSQIRELHSTFIVRQQEMLTSTNLSSNGSFRALKFNTA